MPTREEMLAKGYQFYCLDCNKVFRTLSTRQYEDGHGGRQVARCDRCDCDLFAKLADDSKAGGE